MVKHWVATETIVPMLWFTLFVFDDPPGVTLVYEHGDGSFVLANPWDSAETYLIIISFPATTAASLQS